jgi:hypothetical protein
MSRFIDDLNRVAKAAAPPMGFRAARQTSSGPRLRLVASLANMEDAGNADLVDGADAVLLRLAKADLTAKARPKIAGTLPDIPWGGWLEDVGARKVATLVEAGADFVVFPPSSQVAAAPQDDKTGKILQVESSLSDGLLRAINDLPVDAVLTADASEAGGSTWHHLMLFQRLANLLAKSLLVMAPSDVTADELRTLWEAGVDGVVVGVSAGSAGRLRELRQSVEKFPPRSRKRGRAEAILPRVSTAPEAEPEEEEGDDGDE